MADDEKKFECQECLLMAPEWSRVGKSDICFLCVPLTDPELQEIAEEVTDSMKGLHYYR